MGSQKWKPISDYNGFYEVSNLGNVRSLNRAIDLRNGQKRKVKGRLLSPKKNKDGYLFVTLSKNGVSKNHYVHRLVAAAFILNPRDLQEVNHISGNKANNSTGNLAWVTHSDNVRHAYENDLNTNKGGGHCFAAGVVDNNLGKEFATIKEWCEARGIKYSTGRNLLNGSSKSKTISLIGVTKITKS